MTAATPRAVAGDTFANHDGDTVEVVEVNEAGVTFRTSSDMTHTVPDEAFFAGMVKVAPAGRAAS